MGVQEESTGVGKGRAWGIGHFHAYNLSLRPMNAPAEARVRPAITPTHPRGKVKWPTSGALHLILSMQYHLTRRARSREVRLLGGRVPFASFAPSRAVAIWRSLLRIRTRNIR
ncbi:protein of unknown function [Methanoculleus bourgensis]|uniref:Uncharacterized protein n=1 Tax=Methanoculleus bourgensis TaxID=83986 RepID=A0A0X3BQA2_9EURY|nr:protein of unknown function [Methanoculleus bourgensis]